jgi:hypothetical protein
MKRHANSAAKWTMMYRLTHQVKEKAEKFLVSFIKNQENSELLQHILKTSENTMTLFITVELLTKTYLVDTGIGIIECRLSID